MIKYETKQRKRLLEFFISNSDIPFTVDDIEKSIKDISVSAIYRNVNQMEADGLLRGFQKEGSKKLFYHYIGVQECNNHFHLKCSKCGCILHMHSDDSDALIAAICKSINFNIDKNKTMFFGNCMTCEQR